MSQATELRLPSVRTEGLEIPGGEQFSARVLVVFGRNAGHLNAEKIRDLWVEIIKHPVLFGDEHGRNFDGFMAALLDPRGVWIEIYNEQTGKPEGLAYMTDIVPGFDALGHFTVWDGKAREKEPIITEIMKWMMSRFDLRRITAEIPVYMKGVQRSALRLGFVEEGIKRKASYRSGEWHDKRIMGILREDIIDG